MMNKSKTWIHTYELVKLGLLLAHKILRELEPIIMSLNFSQPNLSSKYSARRAVSLVKVFNFGIQSASFCKSFFAYHIIDFLSMA